VQLSAFRSQLLAICHPYRIGINLTQHPSSHDPAGKYFWRIFLAWWKIDNCNPQTQRKKLVSLKADD
jgi:hypothetical protein